MNAGTIDGMPPPADIEQGALLAEHDGATIILTVGEQLAGAFGALDPTTRRLFYDGAVREIRRQAELEAEQLAERLSSLRAVAGHAPAEQGAAAADRVDADPPKANAGAAAAPQHSPRQRRSPAAGNGAGPAPPAPTRRSGPRRPRVVADQALEQRVREQLQRLGRGTPTAIGQALGYSKTSSGMVAVREVIAAGATSGWLVTDGNVRGRPAYALANGGGTAAAEEVRSKALEIAGEESAAPEGARAQRAAEREHREQLSRLAEQILERLREKGEQSHGELTIATREDASRVGDAIGELIRTGRAKMLRGGGRMAPGYIATDE